VTGRRFGSIRRLPDHVSKDGKRKYKGSYQVRYQVDGKRYTARTADNRPLTFRTSKEAREWLSATETAIRAGTWQAPGTVSAAVDDTPLTFGSYAEAWLSVQDLSPSTQLLYRQLLDHWILPEFADVPIPEITPAQVREWYSTLAVGRTAKSNAYARLRTIMGTAVEDGLITDNPCKIKGAGSVTRSKKIKVAKPAELRVIVENMPEQWRALILLAAWCALRWSELTALQRRDVDFDEGVVRVRRAVVRGPEGKVEKSPKSAAGLRDVPIPPFLVDPLREHLEKHAAPGDKGLLFPAANGKDYLATMSVGRAFYPAREAAGRPDLTLHELRHTGLTRYAQIGATTRELMAIAGHSTPEMALRYQHVEDDRPRLLAAMLSEIAVNGTTATINGRTA
jgi:integrase